jgi:hypothetical protein
MDKETLLAQRKSLIETREVEIEDVGTVTVRGLSRAVFLIAQKRWPDDALAQERYTLSFAMVDPEMTEADIATWQQNSGPYEINKVAIAVNELSGIGKGADKSGVSSV